MADQLISYAAVAILRGLMCSFLMLKRTSIKVPKYILVYKIMIKHPYYSNRNKF